MNEKKSDTIKGRGNAKDRWIIGILLVAVLFAALAAGLVYAYLNPKMVTMYTFNDNYKAGQFITDDMLTPVQVPNAMRVGGLKDGLSNRFVTGENIRQYIYQKDNALRFDVAKGDPLFLSMLSIEGGTGIEQSMNAKAISVSIPVTSVSGVTNDLKGGSYVNIYATGWNNTPGTTLLFEDMKVIDVEKSDNGQIYKATIQVKLDESLKLINASDTSQITLGLVNHSGYEPSGRSNLTYIPGQQTFEEVTEREGETAEQNTGDGESTDAPAPKEE